VKGDVPVFLLVFESYRSGDPVPNLQKYASWKWATASFRRPWCSFFPPARLWFVPVSRWPMTRRAKVVVRLFATFASQDPRCQFKDGRSCLTDRREMIRRWFKFGPNGARMDPACDKGTGRARLRHCSEYMVHRVDLRTVNFGLGLGYGLLFFVTLYWLASCYSTTSVWVRIIRISVNLRCVFREPDGCRATGRSAGVWKSPCRRTGIDGALRSARWRERGIWYWRHCASGNWSRGFEARPLLLKRRGGNESRQCRKEFSSGV